MSPYPPENSSLTQARAVNSGYDGSLMNGLLTMPIFVSAIGTPDGNMLGIITAAYSLGSLASVFAASWVADRFGRKPSMCELLQADRFTISEVRLTQQ